MSREDIDFESLAVGCEGSMVVIAQKMLNSIGYQLNINGDFDEDMAQVVRDFQIDTHSLSVDGIIDAETMMAIDTAISVQQES
jgi:N-acetyl-anhydromuramyl-L-alanine amidase AmpD